MFKIIKLIDGKPKCLNYGRFTICAVKKYTWKRRMVAKLLVTFYPLKIKQEMGGRNAGLYL